MGNHLAIFPIGKSQGLAASGGPAGTTGSVGVCFGGVRHIIVDDMGNAKDIDTPGGNIGRHHNFIGAVAKTVHRQLPLLLGEIALQRGGIESGFFQHQCQALGLVFGTGEDQGTGHFPLAMMLFSREVFLLWQPDREHGK